MDTDDRTQLTMLYENMYQFMISKDTDNLAKIFIEEEKKDTPTQISLAWMLCKKPWVVPIPGTRKKKRMIENAGAAEIILTEKEVTKIDSLLDSIGMSEVFGGHAAKK